MGWLLFDQSVECVWSQGKSYKKRYKMAKEEVASKHEVEEELREEKELTKNLSDKLHRQIVRNREAKQEFDQVCHWSRTIQKK